jgi:alkaline phosphatase D
MLKITRRRALQTALLGSAAACSPAPKIERHAAGALAPVEGFAHGVASGDPGPDSVVIWTRVTPSGEDAIPVEWELATDRDFTDIRARGAATASAGADWTVKAVPAGLAAGGTYYYRFTAGGRRSPTGRTKTLPDGAIDRARFAAVSCSNYPFGHFNVYDLIARRDDLDAVIHLGDYIYEYGPDGYGGETGARLSRAHEPAHEILTLDDYRRRHAQYKSDPSSQAMHGAHPLIAIWDDHEVANDSWSGGAQNHDPATEGDWDARKRAALQAYYEWMPVREPEGAPREALFRAFSYGDLLTVAALETRLMARARPFEYNEIVPTLNTAEDVARFRDEMLWAPERRMLGDAQLDFFEKAFRASREKGQPWRLVANQIIMAEVIAPDLTPHVTEEDIVELEAQWDQARAFVQFSTLNLPTNLDAWDGYPAARQRFYDMARRSGGAEGMIVITGDTHTWWANDLADRAGAPVGVELGVHSVTSPSPYRRSFLGGKGAEYALLTNRHNKSVRYLSGENHGYIFLDIRRSGASAKFIAVDTIEAAEYGAFEKAGFEIRKRRNGAARFAGVSGVTLKERFLFG